MVVRAQRGRGRYDSGRIRQASTIVSAPMSAVSRRRDVQFRAQRGVGVFFDVGDVLVSAVDGEVVDEQVGFEHEVVALQDVVAEDEVAKGAVVEEFVVEDLVAEDEVREEDEWATAKRTRSGSATSKREGLALGCYLVRSVHQESWECNLRTVKCRRLEIDESPATKS